MIGRALVAIALVWAAPAAAQAPAEPAVAARETSFAILPGVFYSQETSVGFALFSSISFPMSPSPDTWLSNVTAVAVYTLENQMSLSTFPTFYLGEANAWVLDGDYVIERFPNQYFGIGNETRDEHQIYRRNRLALATRVLHRLSDAIYFGGTHHFSLTDVDEISRAPWEGADALGTGQVEGEGGSRLNGLGLVARWDTRDNDQSAREGVFIELEPIGYPVWLGSDRAMALLRLDSRGYVPFGDDGTVALQWLNELRTGEVPFTSMGELGGDSVLRGLYQGRFRDHNLTAVQAEVRHDLVWRFRIAGFAGVGQVYRDPADLAESPPKWTLGGGIRYELDEETRTPIRLDIGGGVDGFGFVLTFGEAI